MVKVWIFSLMLWFPALVGAQSLQIQDTVTGDGAELGRHDTAIVHYTGRLEDGTVFDSSHERGRSLVVNLGRGEVIPGWDLGLRGMRVGGTRELVIPPELGYGSQGAGNVIPPNATLHFEVELLDRIPPPFDGLDNAGLAEKIADGVTLVDIRRPEEWAETGIVEGSLRLTAFDEEGQLIPEFFPQFVQHVGPDEPVVLICRTGSRTGLLARALADQANYTQVYNVTDGIVQWLEAEQPVVRE